MRSVYQTNTPDAESIWNEGFRDADLIDDDGCASEKFAGVRLFDNPRRWNRDPDGNNLLLAIEIPADLIGRYEWSSERQHHWLTELKTREFLVLASAVNYYGLPVVEEVELLFGLLGDIDLSGI